VIALALSFLVPSQRYSDVAIVAIGGAHVAPRFRNRPISIARMSRSG
jgi:hypothetical protein